MKIFRNSLMSLIAIVIFSVAAEAEDLATKEECKQKCSEVVKLIQSNGPEEAIKQVNDVKGQFVWKDTYVYIMNLEATIIAHGPQPKFIGKNLMGLKDPITKTPFYPAVFEKIKLEKSASGWFDYHWGKPDAEGVYKKSCYFERVGDLVVFAGIYGEKVE